MGSAQRYAAGLVSPSDLIILVAPSSHCLPLEALPLPEENLTGSEATSSSQPSRPS